ncbi:MAG: hypothetical protein KDL87_18580, partial [Verrucomicrobiae bacterium]|nr:hypothetical protein [Verrucomicrobiae bacterium]
MDRIVEQRYPMPQFVPLSQIVNNWTNVPDRAYPEQVKINEKLPFVLRGSDGKAIGSSIASPGTLVKPVSLRGSTLVVASLANQSMRSEISVEKTDFKQQVEKRYNDFILNMTNRVRQQREKAKVALLAKPETLAALTGGSAASFGPTDDPRLVPVKASLSKGEVKAFNLDEAVGFR